MKKRKPYKLYEHYKIKSESAYTWEEFKRWVRSLRRLPRFYGLVAIVTIGLFIGAWQLIVPMVLLGVVAFFWIRRSREKDWH